jgi:FkbM family methyltransferase
MSNADHATATATNAGTRHRYVDPFRPARTAAVKHAPRCAGGQWVRAPVGTETWSRATIPLTQERSQMMSLYGTYVGNNRLLIRLVGGGRLLVSADDLSLMPELVTEGGYDAPFTAFLRATLPPDGVFVDVGANVGLFTVIGALATSRGRVIAYEPVPELLELLRANVQLNWLAGRVTIRDVAVAERAGKRPFTFDPTMQILGGIVPDEIANTNVDVVALDDDLEHLERINLVKIDVEGAEPAVLAGMDRLLRSGRVDRISCEVRSDAFERQGLRLEWRSLIERLHDLEARGWTFAIIEPDGGLAVRSVNAVIATEPHPNVVVAAPGQATGR